MGVCVTSESRRYTLPGAMTASGGLRESMVRTCMVEVCVRSTTLSSIYKVSCMSRAGCSGGMFRASKQ